MQFFSITAKSGIHMYKQLLPKIVKWCQAIRSYQPKIMELRLNCPDKIYNWNNTYQFLAKSFYLVSSLGGLKHSTQKRWQQWTWLRSSNDLEVEQRKEITLLVCRLPDKTLHKGAIREPIQTNTEILKAQAFQAKLHRKAKRKALLLIPQGQKKTESFHLYFYARACVFTSARG